LRDNATVGNAQRLLVVEDDPALGGVMSRVLTDNGYECTWTVSIADTAEIDDAPDLVLLDLGLPDGDGLDLCRTLRQQWPWVGVLVVTARSEESDIVVGLDAGACDYVTKPFSVLELLARVRAQLRRGEDMATEALVDGDLRVDRAARRVFLDGTEIALTSKQFDLLVEFVSHPDEVLTRSVLMERVWDTRWYGSTKTLDVTIAGLRRRLGEEPGTTSRITALRGVGYRWEGRS
jgi:DNA-binding response OmpR family regulator